MFFPSFSLHTGWLWDETTCPLASDVCSVLSFDGGPHYTEDKFNKFSDEVLRVGGTPTAASSIIDAGNCDRCELTSSPPALCKPSALASNIRSTVQVECCGGQCDQRGTSLARGPHHARPFATPVKILQRTFLDWVPCFSHSHGPNFHSRALLCTSMAG